jgi:hypothetical protein
LINGLTKPGDRRWILVALLLCGVTLQLGAESAGIDSDRRVSSFPPGVNRGLSFDGLNDSVDFGRAPELNAGTFTLEVWFKWNGGGRSGTTGTDGIVAYPLISKGPDEGDGSVLDANYFLGIQLPGAVLAADFEEHSRGTSPGRNHPVVGKTAIAPGVWYHAAATYDGTCWQLYLNGQPETDGDICPAEPPNFDSTQPLALGAALDSEGGRRGHFSGTLDEARIWGRALDGETIGKNMYRRFPLSTTGLIGWFTFDGVGEVIENLVVRDTTGGIVSGAERTVDGVPLPDAQEPSVEETIEDLEADPPVGGRLSPHAAPDLPTNEQPPDGSTGVEANPQLCVTVTDPDADPMDVTFHGREIEATGAEEFTFIALPDTQYYSQTYPEVFLCQTEWVLDEGISTTGSCQNPLSMSPHDLNVVFTGQLGDCVQNGDNSGDDTEWQNAEAALGLFDPAGDEEKMPFAVCVGNHDQGDGGNGGPGTLTDPASTTVFYNQFLGVTRFQGRTYYGGSFTHCDDGSICTSDPDCTGIGAGTCHVNNDNHYVLFSAGGMDFILIQMEYDHTSSALRAAVIAWANDVLTRHSNRRAIIASHYVLNQFGNFPSQGAAIPDARRPRERSHAAHGWRRSDPDRGHVDHDHVGLPGQHLRRQRRKRLAADHDLQAGHRRDRHQDLFAVPRPAQAGYPASRRPRVPQFRHLLPHADRAALRADRHRFRVQRRAGLRELARKTSRCRVRVVRRDHRRPGHDLQPALHVHQRRKLYRDCRLQRRRGLHGRQLRRDGRHVREHSERRQLRRHGRLHDRHL